MKPTLLMPGKAIDKNGKIIPKSKSMRTVDYVLDRLEKNSKRYPLFLLSKTASGKSTVFPAELYKKTKKRIAITQPRIANAKTIPKDIVKWNKNIVLGRNIGFLTSVARRRIRGDGLTFMTLGTLLHRMEKYDYILIDECHERDLYLDIITYKIKEYLKKNWQRRNCPKFVFMSATFDTEKYQKYFGGGEIVSVTGRAFPLEFNFLPDSTIEDIVKNVHETRNGGDILLFVAQTRDIDMFKEKFQQLDNVMVAVFTSATYRARGEDYDIIYNTETDKRKIIIATNVAQTGLTIESIDYVIDTSLALKPIYYPDKDISVLQRVIISKAEVRQRIGRAGRVRPGFGFLPYSKEKFDSLLENDYPDILSKDIAELILYYLIDFYEIESEDFKVKPKDLTFDFLDKPPSDLIVRAMEKLFILGFIDSYKVPTKLGFIATKFQKISLESRKMILSGVVWGISIKDLVVTAVMVEMSRELDKIKHEWSDIAMDDFFDYMNSYYIFDPKEDNEKMFNAISVIHGNLGFIEDNGMKFEELDYDDFLKYIVKYKHCIYEGYKMNVARKTKKGYIAIRNQRSIKINSAAKFVVYNNFAGYKPDAISSMSHIGIDENYFNL